MTLIAIITALLIREAEFKHFPDDVNSLRASPEFHVIRIWTPFLLLVTLPNKIDVYIGEKELKYI